LAGCAGISLIAGIAGALDRVGGAARETGGFKQGKWRAHRAVETAGETGPSVVGSSGA